jgi:hypothetical protein
MYCNKKLYNGNQIFCLFLSNIFDIKIAFIIKYLILTLKMKFE